MFELDKQALTELRYGCTFSANGGGRLLNAGLHLLENLEGIINVISKAHVVAITDSYTIVANYIGAHYGRQNVFQPTAAVSVFDLMNEIAIVKITYTVSVEKGALAIADQGYNGPMFYGPTFQMQLNT